MKLSLLSYVTGTQFLNDLKHIFGILSADTCTDTDASAISQYRPRPIYLCSSIVHTSVFLRVTLLHNNLLERFNGLEMLHRANTLHIKLIKPPF